MSTVCEQCDGFGGTINMIKGYPGYFILVPCAKVCFTMPGPCLVCSKVGLYACLVHSEAPFLQRTVVDGSLAIRRDINSSPGTVRDHCGDISGYLASFYRI